MSKRRNRKARRSASVQEVQGAAAGDTGRTNRRFDFNPDYSFVRKDLQRIAVLTGIFLSVLVILSFVLR